MSGINTIRKRTRSDADELGVDASATATGVKRQRLANEPPAIVVDGERHSNGAPAPASRIGRLSALATTPKTPRTANTVASAITGALAYGVGSLIGSVKAQGKLTASQGQQSSTLASRPFATFRADARGTSPHALDTDPGLGPDATDTDMPETPTAKKTASAARRSAQQARMQRKDDDNENDTLVGSTSVSPTPGTPTKTARTPKAAVVSDVAAETAEPPKKRGRGRPPKNASKPAETAVAAAAATAVTATATAEPPAATAEAPKKRGRGRPPKNASQPAETAVAAAATAEPPAATAEPPMKRGRGRPPKDPSQPSKYPARKTATPKPVVLNADGTVKRGPGRPRKNPIVEEDPLLKLAQAKALSLAKQQKQAEAAHDEDDVGETCLICGKPDSEPPNEIILCDTCDLAVHQQCYNVPVIPEGDWFCKNCVRKQEQAEQQRKQASATPAGDETEDDTSTDRQTSELPAAADKDKDDLAADAAAATPPRDLAPDIANFESHLAKTKRILLGRCTGRHRVRLQGQDEAYNKVYQVVEQTVVAGEGNSMMVIGARGTGKTTMVETILDDLAAEHGGAFHVVRLNGFIHTDDKLALREIWRQLGKEMAVDDDVVSKTNNYADTLASLLALLSHPSEIEAAAVGSGTDNAASAPAVTSTAVVFIMDEFDLFATHARQTLLYNLFDIAQARKAPIAVLGLTTKIDVVESLEKRVKSRFSHRYVYLSLPRTMPAYWDICRYGLVVDEAAEAAADVRAVDLVQDKGHAEFQQWWKHMIDTAKDDAAFQEQLAFHFYSSKSVPEFWTTCVMPLAAVSSAAPRLRLPPVGGHNAAATTDVVRSVGRPSLAAAAAASAALANAGKPFDAIQALPLSAPDSKLHLLASLSELELSLLITAARLDIVLSTDTVNFAMAYDEYVSLMGKQRVQSSLSSSGIVGIGSAGGSLGAGGGLVIGGGARVWGRGVASRAWERLAALGLLIPASMGANARGRPGALITSGLEGRSMWRCEVSLEEIPAAPGVRLGAVLGRWCKEI